MESPSASWSRAAGRRCAGAVARCGRTSSGSLSPTRRARVRGRCGRRARCRRRRASLQPALHEVHVGDRGQGGRVDGGQGARRASPSFQCPYRSRDATATCGRAATRSDTAVARPPSISFAAALDHVIRCDRLPVAGRHRVLDRCREHGHEADQREADRAAPSLWPTSAVARGPRTRGRVAPGTQRAAEGSSGEPQQGRRRSAGPATPGRRATSTPPTASGGPEPPRTDAWPPPRHQQAATAATAPGAARRADRMPTDCAQRVERDTPRRAAGRAERRQERDQHADRAERGQGRRADDQRTVRQAACRTPRQAGAGRQRRRPRGRRPRGGGEGPDRAAPRPGSTRGPGGRSAPAARSTAISRVRDATTMENVLAIRNAPTSSDAAAIASSRVCR